jgi:hypothetical protein
LLNAAEGGAPREKTSRFERALAAGPTDGGREADAQILCALAEAGIKRTGEVPYGSNAVFILELDAPDPVLPDRRMRAVYKPARGERPLWDFPNQTLYLREVAAYWVDAALELGHLPPVVLRAGPLGPGSVQLFVHSAEQRPSAEQAAQLEDQIREVAAFDVIVNNADRKRSHLMIRRDFNLCAIDNALTFLPYPRQRTALIALGGAMIPESFSAHLRAFADDPERLAATRGRLARVLAQREVDAFIERVNSLAANPVYPVLDEWEGRPFEWW